MIVTAATIAAGLVTGRRMIIPMAIVHMAIGKLMIGLLTIIMVKPAIREDTRTLVPTTIGRLSIIVVRPAIREEISVRNVRAMTAILAQAIADAVLSWEIAIFLVATTRHPTRTTATSADVRLLEVHTGPSPLLCHKPFMRTRSPRLCSRLFTIDRSLLWCSRLFTQARNQR